MSKAGAGSHLKRTGFADRFHNMLWMVYCLGNLICRLGTRVKVAHLGGVVIREVSKRKSLTSSRIFMLSCLSSVRIDEKLHCAHLVLARAFMLSVVLSLFISRVWKLPSLCFQPRFCSQRGGTHGEGNGRSLHLSTGHLAK